MRDFVFPKNNEELFIAVAEKLGYNELVFVYPFDERAINSLRAKIDKLKLKTNLFISFGIIAGKDSLLKAKRYSDSVLYKSDGDDRYVFETVKNCIVFSLEAVNRKDAMHFRNSGLNQVLCKLANKNNITIGFSFSDILGSNLVTKSRLLGRIGQNLRFCRKYDVKTISASFTDNHYEMRYYKDLDSLMRLLKFR